MFFNSEAYKKAFPKEEKPAARPENTCELYDENDVNDTAPEPDEINEPAEEANDGDDADITEETVDYQTVGEEE